ncbi:MAG: hypothetical protein ACREQQ_02670 [Candidatus Binatia bacterium]
MKRTCVLASVVWILWRVGVGGTASGVQAVWLPEDSFAQAKDCYTAQTQARRGWDQEKAKWGPDKSREEVVVRFTCLPDTINPPH